MCILHVMAFSGENGAEAGGVPEAETAQGRT